MPSLPVSYSLELLTADEVNALVLDLGTYSFKAGFSGDDTPKAIFPSMAGVHAVAGMEVDGSNGNAPSREISVGHQALSVKQLGMEVLSPFGPNDLYNDWDVVQALYNHAIQDRLAVKAEDFALMIAEPTHNTRAARERLVEIMFESSQAPALFLARNAMLSAFATARQTALVVDAGYRSTTAAAVQDGYVLQKSVSRTPLAGQFLNHAAQAVAEAQYSKLRPRCSFRKQDVRPGEFEIVPVDTTGVTNSFYMYQVEQVASDIKEAICRASETRYYETEGVSNASSSATYELPDGQQLYVVSERFRMAELLFQPQAFIGHFKGLTLPPEVRSVPEIVVETINKCDVDLRKDMYSGAVLTGGTSLVQGFKERLEKEVSDLSPPAAKVKMVAASNAVERRFSTWIGGSILSSLGTFQQLWMSKKEYGEHGAPLINRKCP